MTGVSLGKVLVEAQPGFACGTRDDAGVFQFRMHNVSKSGELVLNSRRRVPRNAHRKIERFQLAAGDVLFNVTNSPDNVGKSALLRELDELTVFSNHFLRLRPDLNRLDPAYLWRWLQLQFHRGVFKSMCQQWVNQATVNRQAFLALKIPLPPFEVQRRIAEILDQVDAIRANRRQILDHLDTLTQSIFHDMFGALDGDRWEQVLLGDLVGRIDNGSSPNCEARPASLEEWGVLKLGAVTYGFFQPTENKAYLGDLGSMVNNEVQAGDVLMTRKNTRELVGAVALVDEVRPRLLLPDLIFRLHLDTSRIDRRFFHALMMHPRKRRVVRDLSSGSAASMPNISKARLVKLMIELPPLKMQREFAIRVEQINVQRTIVRRTLDADDELFASLQARAFKGEL